MTPKVLIYSGKASEYLSEKIAKAHGTELGRISYTKFSDGEFEVSYESTVRGSELFIIQSTFSPVDNLFELLLLVDAAKRASAHHIYAVIPYFGFARQDRKSKPRVAIGAKLVANLLSAAGVDRIITMDLHSDQIQGFFDVPVDHLYASTIFVPFLKQMNLPNLIVASPDTGGTKRANAYSRFLNCDMVICYKQREKPNQVGNIMLIGDVTGKDVVFLDDIIDTAGSITKAADLIMDSGANSVRAMCTHPILSDDAIEKIDASSLIEVIVTDTIPLKKQSKKITVLSTAELFADVIHRNILCESISTHFDINTII
jgi:ribose-phosphate pyrophosphokinase